MSSLIVEQYVDDVVAHARREDRPDPQPWYRREERATPKPTRTDLFENWHALMAARGLRAPQ